MVTTSCRALRRRAGASLCAARQRLLAWLTSATGVPVAGALGELARTKAALLAESALLRQSPLVLRRQVRRPALTPAERLRLVLLTRLARGWRAALLIVQPDTLLRWHRQGRRLVWRARSAVATKQPQVPAETVALIQRLAAEHRRLLPSRAPPAAPGHAAAGTGTVGRPARAPTAPVTSPCAPAHPRLHCRP